MKTICKPQTRVSKCTCRHIYRTTVQCYAADYEPSVFPVSQGFSSIYKWQLAFQGLLSVEMVESSCRRISICLSRYGMLVCHRLQSAISIMICTHLSSLLLSFSFTAITYICGTQLACLVRGRRDGCAHCVCVNCDEMASEGVEHIRMTSSHQINVFIFHRMANFLGQI